MSSEALPERYAPSVSECVLRTERDVSSALVSLLGEDPGPARGVIHVAACFRGEGGQLQVLKIGAAAPSSASDFFLLQATRARAEAIVTTAEILRSEPSLSHDFAGSYADALRAYRRACFGADVPVQVVVLTRTGQLPSEHPVYRDRARVRVLAPQGVVSELSRRLPTSVQVESWSASSLRGVIVRLRSEGLQTISIEAGPRSANSLYETEPMVDEVCLSIYEGGEVGEAARGGALPADASLFAGLGRTAGDALVDEPSGRFRFARWVRRTR